MIKNASWRGIPLKNIVLPIVAPFKPSQTGESGFGTITVDASSVKEVVKNQRGKHPEKIRLHVKEDDITQNGVEELLSEEQTCFHSNETLLTNVNIPLDGEYNGETENKAIDRINERFQILDEITEAVAIGAVKSVIVSGPPGVGKSFGVERILQELNGMELFVANTAPKYEFIKGDASPIGLYQTLYKHSDKDHVVVFDDCDSVLLDGVSLSLLKAALDTNPKRMLSWNKESYALRDSGVPEKFQFKGGIIFITNLDFMNVRSKLLKPHLEAMLSRSHYLNLDIKTQRDKFLRIKGVTERSEMLDDYDFTVEQRNEILDYIKKNVNSLQELSLRTVLKLADLYKMKKGNGWQRIADITLRKKYAA